MNETAFAFITLNGVYLVSEGRWAKATAFVEGVPAGWGDWAALTSVARGGEGMSDWEITDLAGVKVGDVVLLRSGAIWAAISEIQAVMTGASAVVMSRESAIAHTGPLLLLQHNQAWILCGDGTGIALGAEGKRDEPIDVAAIDDQDFIVVVIASDTERKREG